MKKIILFLTAIAIILAACSRTERHLRDLYQAESIVCANPDSALLLLRDIEFSDLTEDSLKALYYIVTAAAHKANETSMVSDSLLRFSINFYKDRDSRRFLQATDLYALHLFWSGKGNSSLELLDSMISQPDVPDDIMIQLLKSRIGVGGAEFDCRKNIDYIRRLQKFDLDSATRIEYEYQLCENYQFADHSDSALIIIDGLIDYAFANNLRNDQFKYTYEKIGILEELGRYEESNALTDYVLENAPHNSALPYLYFWKALNHFNLGNLERSSRELAVADSCAEGRIDVDRNYYESFASPLREFLAYGRNGTIRLSQLATINNSQRDLFNRMEATRWDAEQNALRQENRALTLKARNDRTAATLIIVVLAAVIISLIAVWNVQKRKRRIMEVEERVETLQKMVDELNAPAPDPSGQESLRRAMLQQLGIIKMVAETPTEQNREMLRKISSIDADTRGALVDWNNVYDIIDNLYSGFHSRLLHKYGDTLTDKERQIIVLMVAGFSTKEIGVITMQTAATVYVRKSSIRKKLGIPEKEDIIAFLRRENLLQDHI